MSDRTFGIAVVVGLAALIAIGWLYPEVRWIFLGI